MYNCYECRYCKFMKGSVRGVMDCDPDEWYCSKDMDEYFFVEEKDLPPEDPGCPKWSEADYDYGPDPDDWYDEWRENRDIEE